MKKHFALLIAIALLTACASSDVDPSKLDSDDYNDKAERIEKLKAEIISFSDFQDAEFELFNVNGFQDQRASFPPGASSWDYKFGVKIDTAHISKWTAGMKEVELADYDDTWTREITVGRKQNWVTSSKPQYFIREVEDVTMLFFKVEGILYKRVTNL